MLSKSKSKHILALHQKKFRQIHQEFLVEGEKMAEEVLQQKHFKIKTIVAISDWIAQHKSKLLALGAIEIIEASSNDLEKISALKTANQVLMVLESPQNETSFGQLKGLQLVLDTIQDPGNLGTIIRIADWFGIENIFCSPDSVEVYNPKVIQATMGSFLRIKVHYVDLEKLFLEHSELPRYGALLHGKNLYEHQLPKDAFLLIGNESKGLSESIQQQVSHPIMIPRYGQAESLNAAIATGILCAAFKM